ncbi:MAG: hypothetical protein ACYCY7_07990 [Gallionella sp.]
MAAADFFVISMTAMENKPRPLGADRLLPVTTVRFLAGYITPRPEVKGTK